MNIQRVHIEFQRVQTWLFAVPRLRAMVGANVLLGETLRLALPELARQETAWKMAPYEQPLPGADPDDPLADHDNPAEDARTGILARDGGHFEAQFASGAEVFAAAAGELLRNKLPGLRFRISIDGIEQPKNQVLLSTELPVLAPCEWTGRGLASASIAQGEERHDVSIDVKNRHEAAKRTENLTARDVASLVITQTRLPGFVRPEDLETLVGNGYLAIIHADGNGIGKSKPTDEAGAARFFHRNRVLLRRAVQHAIDVTCDPKERYAPLIPLMLGGDDLLLVCRAKVALPFVVALCDHLAKLQQETPNDFELTLGVGVVFAKRSVPIHRLHEVAEQLATSAKRRFRGATEAGQKGRSVVDWNVYGTSWVDDPEEIRRRDWLRTDALGCRVLSQRPLDVLGSGLNSLEGLVIGASKLEAAARSQLRYLVDQLPRGRHIAELAFEELPREAKNALQNAGVDRVWRRSEHEQRTYWQTEIFDLVELSEIRRLGRSTGKSHIKQEVRRG